MSRTRNPAKVRAQGRTRQNAKTPRGAGEFLVGTKLTSKSLNAALCFLLGAVTIAVYSPVLGHSFVVFDDRDYVTPCLSPVLGQRKRRFRKTCIRRKTQRYREESEQVT
jgi:hypothetical protein